MNKLQLAVCLSDDMPTLIVLDDNGSKMECWSEDSSSCIVSIRALLMGIELLLILAFLRFFFKIYLWFEMIDWLSNQILSLTHLLGLSGF